ncbi:hypothetical protein GR217_34420 [Rhizobium leguminosarum]|uniref:Uncharacterized protein n=1 Tax=Rhizobium ruizarguesonis TaxID=2081791 RepID=A0AAE4YWT3_9HYPH|nr:hypothetical protein [Rhizobium ruizarguesonis]NEI52716.1 hypothetical protein [Rhizobium ruizarguesonis]
MPTSPNVLNYFIGKGIIKFTPSGGSQRDLGNAPEIEMTPATEKLDHFSSRTGVRTKDRSITLEKSLALRIVLDELTAENLALLLLGEVTSNTAGNSEFEIFSESEIKGVIAFQGTNDIGNKVNVSLPSVSFGPSGSLNLISDEWGQVELTGEVLQSAGSFGTIEIIDAS